MSVDSKCGFCGYYPKWLQGLATTKTFIVVYGLLGTVQSMAFIYISVSLTTLEKRFKIQSRTTGILLSGYEVSQILAVILIYYGSSGHRPRWIATGVGFSGLSCLGLALPHLIYGPGQEALALTHEYLNATLLSTGISKKNELPICSNSNRPESCDVESQTDSSIVPRLLVFFSQFILGIGTSLYYGLGQIYMDDNTKKKNTPLILGITFSLRTIGPVFGFVLSYFCLKLYIDPTLHPIIEEEDPRWLGAWWLGWIILGLMMGVSSFFIAMFPRELPKSNKKKVPDSESEVPLKTEQTEEQLQNTQSEKPSMKEFPIAVKRILTNKLFVLNNIGGVFYIFSSAPFIYFIGKYLEVQYGTSSGGGTIITGPIKLVGLVFGFLISGAVIGKYKPSARPLLFWNVLAGVAWAVSRLVIMYISCDTGDIQGVNFDTMTLNLTEPCNAACNCELVKFSPVCHEATGTTYFSACHAGCLKIINDTFFGDCSCLFKVGYGITNAISKNASIQSEDQFNKTIHNLIDIVTVGPCKQDCFKPYIIFSVMSGLSWIVGCSARIGNVLLNYRCVESRDKSLAQGISLMIVSLFAFIPGSIFAGAIMDSTCLIWDITCKDQGNCWVYHKDNFRYIVNISGIAFCVVAIFFDAFVWYYCKGLELYGEEEDAEKRRIAQIKKAEHLNENDTFNPKY